MMMCSSRMTWKDDRMGLQSSTGGNRAVSARLRLENLTALTTTLTPQLLGLSRHALLGRHQPGTQPVT